MDEDVRIEEDDAPQAVRAGEMLREARQARGLDIAQVAAETRIPQRHLQAIENGEYERLPSRTYAIGFSRSYARLLGLEEETVLHRVREELADGEHPVKPRSDRFEPGDPARVPSRRLAWFSAFAVLLLVAGGFTFYRTYFSPGLGPPPLTVPSPTPTLTMASREQRETASSRLPAASGPVVFTSEIDGTWVKFYDGDGKRLYEAQMAKGQSYTIPADASDPMIWTGRPYALAITVGGRPVPKISEKDEVVKDVPVTAQALLARGAEQAPAAQASPEIAASPASAPSAAGM